MKTESNNPEQLTIGDLLIWIRYDYRTTVVVIGALLLCLLALYIWFSENKFHERCGVFLEQAAAASSVDIAKEQLAQVISGCKSYQAQATNSFWTQNFEQQAKNLQISQNANFQEQYFALEQFRESIKNAKESMKESMKYRGF